MNLRSFINKIIILSVFAIAGYLLARSLYYGSFLGIVLALVGIIAWGMFLFQLNKTQEKQDIADELAENY